MTTSIKGLPPIHCIKCGEKTDSRDVERTTLSNGRPAVRAVCVVCGRGKFSIGHR